MTRKWKSGRRQLLTLLCAFSLFCATLPTVYADRQEKVQIKYTVTEDMLLPAKKPTPTASPSPTPKPTATPSKTDAPKTGDESNIKLYALVGAAGALGAITIYCKLKEHEKHEGS